LADRLLGRFTKEFLEQDRLNIRPT
jgi:hypothetical protein